MLPCNISKTIDNYKILYSYHTKQVLVNWNPTLHKEFDTYNVLRVYQQVQEKIISGVLE